MRNWNSGGRRFFSFPIVRSQPTYEELKLQLTRVFAPSAKVLSLPMRNWNTWSPWPVTWPPVFSAYLWGIETQLCSKIQLRRGRSQPTYEELKQEKYSLALPGQSGSQPTYEELKRTASLEEYTGKDSSQPTYEELKPTGETLPDGGTGGSQPTYEELKHRNKITALWRFRVLSLPMRNWNSLRWFNSRQSREGSQPTYEELKLIIPLLVPCCNPGSQPTYEELKHQVAYFLYGLAV